MDDFSSMKWQIIKALSAKMEALIVLLKSFSESQFENYSATEMKVVFEQLEAEFAGTLNALIELIDSEDLNAN